MDAEATAQAFEKIGFLDKAECFRLAQSLLPDNFQALSDNEQTEIIEQHEDALDKLADKVIGDSEMLEIRLAKYIDENRHMLKP